MAPTARRRWHRYREQRGLVEVHVGHRGRLGGPQAGVEGSADEGRRAPRHGKGRGSSRKASPSNAAFPRLHGRTPVPPCVSVRSLLMNRQPVVPVRRPSRADCAAVPGRQHRPAIPLTMTGGIYTANRKARCRAGREATQAWRICVQCLAAATRASSARAGGARGRLLRPLIARDQPCSRDQPAVPPLWTAARAWSMIIRGGQIAVV